MTTFVLVILFLEQFRGYAIPGYETMQAYEDSAQQTREQELQGYSKMRAFFINGPAR
jgi:hypothetical protein